MAYLFPEISGGMRACVPPNERKFGVDPVSINFWLWNQSGSKIAAAAALRGLARLTEKRVGDGSTLTSNPQCCKSQDSHLSSIIIVVVALRCPSYCL